MNKKSLSVLLSFLLIWVLFTAPAWAGQVVTDEVKAWAKGAIEQEKALKTVSAPNTVAVLYFSNKTGWSDLDILQKGLTLMLITDLSKVEEIQVVERVKVQALVEELDLEVSGLVKPSTSSQMGKLLGVELLVGGDILKGKIEELFQLKSNLLKVQTEKVVGRPWTEGELLAELFRMEKELLFEIIKELKIELSPELEAELKKPLTTNLTALLYLFEGIDHSDRGNYSKAAESYKKAMAEDPNLGQAEAFLWELQALNLWAGAIEAYSEPEWGGILEPADYDIPEDIDLTAREDNFDQLDIDIYQYTQGNPPPIVAQSSVTEAANNIVNDDTLLASVVNGDFFPGDLSQIEPAAENQWWEYDWSGPYEYGLQTLGSDADGNPQVYLTEENLAWINEDPFLAYAVQVEEDIVNRKILEMHQDAYNRDLINTLMGNINTALGYAEIRERDAWFTQQADAQAGRVLKDIHGNWVRIQQYVLRPDAQTVQVLNVCLRGAGGNLAGLSTMDWTTTFTDGYNGDLRNLPWNDWLTTQIDDNDDRYVWSNINDPELETMYVKFTNPANESLKESRQFDTRVGGEQQYINDERLTINASAEYVYTGPGTLDDGQYQVVSTPAIGNNPSGFKYVFRSGGIERDVNVAFFVVGDAHQDDNVGEMIGYGEVSLDDIWDALRVNISEWPDIGNNNLEIVIDGQGNYFSNPIDVVYIPMSRMLWKDLPQPQ